MENDFELNDTVAVYKVADGRKTKWFDGLIRGITTRGLFLCPINEPKEHGFSDDINAATWISYSRFNGNATEFRLIKKFKHDKSKY